MSKITDNRAHKINSDDASRETDLKFISKVFQRNSFPLTLLKKVMSAYRPSQPDTEPSTNLDNTVIDKRYFKLPFVGDFSRAANKKLINLVRRCCTENIDARFSFDTFKLGQYFSTKNPAPEKSISQLINHFSCADCYVGETARHFEKRVDEHLRTDKKSAVYKHLKANPACKRSSNVECFSILDKARKR